MTKGEAIEIILLAANGGKFSSDNNVKRGEVASFFSVAVADAQRRAMFEDRAQRRADRQLELSGLIELFDDIYFSAYIRTPIKDEDSNIFYVTTPALLNIPRTWAIKSVRPVKNIGVTFEYTQSFSALIGAEHMFGSQIFYSYEAREAETRLYFSAPWAPMCDVRILAAVNPSGADDESVLSAPDHVIFQAIRSSVQHFFPQAQMPSDNIFDNKGPNEHGR